MVGTKPATPVVEPYFEIASSPHYWQWRSFKGSLREKRSNLVSAGPVSNVRSARLASRAPARDDKAVVLEAGFVITERAVGAGPDPAASDFKDRPPGHVVSADKLAEGPSNPDMMLRARRGLRTRGAA